MRIAINLATRHYVDVEPIRKRLQSAMIVLLILCGGLAIISHFSYTAAKRLEFDDRNLDQTIAAESSDLAKFKGFMLSGEGVRTAARTGALNQLFDEKSFSWTRLMMTLEGVVPSSVQLATIQPVREKDGTINLHLHVVGPRADAVKLVEGLESTSNFILPRILSETARGDARPNEQPAALSDTSIEEFDIVSGYTEADPAPVQSQPGSATTSDSGSRNPQCGNCAASREQQSPGGAQLSQLAPEHMESRR